MRNIGQALNSAASEETVVTVATPVTCEVPKGVRWSALAFAMVFPGLIAWVYFLFLTPPGGAGSVRAFWAFPVYALSKLVQFSFPVLWTWQWDRQRLRLPSPSVRGLAVGVAFGLLIIALTSLAYWGILRGSALLASTPASVVAKLRVFHADTRVRYLILCLFVAVVHSLLEEYYWR